MDILIQKTGSKQIVECANDCLWGTRVNLNRNDCLNSEKWIGPGILGKILESIRNSHMQNRGNYHVVLPGNTEAETAETMQMGNEPTHETRVENNENNNAIN